jgi:Uncharacterized protein conserved in bacteria
MDKVYLGVVKQSAKEIKVLCVSPDNIESERWYMIIETLEIRLYAPWVHSLKEKRMIVRSLTAKIRNRFNVSVAETADQDLHQSIVLGIACVAGNTGQADSIMDHIETFIESNTEAEITGSHREIY